MKQIFTLVLLLCGVLASQNAMANSVTFYAKCKVQVAEESIGRGTVYLLAGNDEEVEEATDFGNAMDSGSGVDGAYVSFNYVAHPEPGFEFVNFTDADGKVYEVGNGYVAVYATSQEEAAPTEFTLFGHFQEAQPEDPNYHFSTQVYSSMKFGLMVIPTDFTLPETLNAYTAEALEGDKIVLQKVEGVVPAGTPVILENLTDADLTVTAEFDKNLIVDGLHTQGVLHGGYTDVWAPEGAYNLMAYPRVEFQKVDSDFPVPAFSCYLAGESEAESFLIDTTILTGINKIVSGAEKPQIFDASGRSLNSLQKGLNIVNGMKVLVK